MDRKPESTVVKVLAVVLLAIVAILAWNIIWGIIRSSFILLMDAVVLVLIGAGIIYVMKWFRDRNE